MKPFILITGMHRSGTSFLARALNLSGVYLGPPQDFISDEWRPAVDNLKGHWENKKILELTEKTFTLNKGSWDQLPKSFKINQKLAREISKFCKQLRDYPALASGFKDPRLIPCLDSWKKCLPRNLVVIGIFRDPLKTAESLKTRNGFNYEKSLELWQKYNAKLLMILKKHDGFLLNFDWPKNKLISEINLIAKKLGLIETDFSDWFSEELLHSDKKYQKKYKLSNEIKKLDKELNEKSKKNSRVKIRYSHSSNEIKNALFGLQQDLNNQGEYFRKVNDQNLKLIKGVNALFSVYLKRKDLQKKFPEVLEGNYKKFLDWAVNWGTIKKEKESTTILPFRELYESSLTKIKKDEELIKKSKKFDESLSKLSGKENELATNKAKLDESLSKLSGKENELATNKAKLDDTLSKLTGKENEIITVKNKLDEALNGLENADDEIAKKSTTLDETVSKLSNTEQQLAEKSNTLDETVSKLSNTVSKLSNTEQQLAEKSTTLDETKSKLSNTDQQLAEKSTTLDETKSKLSNTESKLSNTDQQLAEKKAESNSLRLDLESIKSSTSFYVINKIFRWVDRNFPINTKRREPIRLSAKGLFILRTQGFKGLSSSFKERRKIRKFNSPKDERPNPNKKIPLEENFVCGIDSDLNSKISENNRTILIRGWCYHKDLKIKNLFLIFDGHEQKISNFGFPRLDIFSSEGHPNSAKSGFWKIITLPKMNENADIYLRVVFEDYEQLKHKLVTLQIKRAVYS